MSYDSINFEIEREPIIGTRIKVIGVGGAGCNTVNDMISIGLNNVEFYAVNTDIKALRKTCCPHKIQIGQEITGGNGAGSDPEMGQRAAADAKEIIKDLLFGSHLAFITAGLGKGTGTGASPVVAQIAKELGIVTIAIVTRPFHFEGQQRMNVAERGLEKLRQICDTVVVISNERIIEVVGKRATFIEAFKAANGILAQGIKSISELINGTGLINVDFADIKSILSMPGNAVIGIGVGTGENRAMEAVKKAYSNKLLDRIVIDGAKGLLIYITGGPDLGLQEVYDAANIVAEAADPEAVITFGAATNDSLRDQVKVIVIATGLKEEIRHTMRRSAQSMNHAIRGQVVMNSSLQPAMLGNVAYANSDVSNPEINQEGYPPDSPVSKQGYEGKESPISQSAATEDSESEYYDIPAYIRRRKNRKRDKQLKLF